MDDQVTEVASGENGRFSDEVNNETIADDRKIYTRDPPSTSKTQIDIKLIDKRYQNYP